MSVEAELLLSYDVSSGEPLIRVTIRERDTRDDSVHDRYISLTVEESLEVAAGINKAALNIHHGGTIH
jgi:hypothetical protein